MGSIGETHRKLDLPGPEPEPEGKTGLGLEKKFATFDWSQPMQLRLVTPINQTQHFVRYIKSDDFVKSEERKPICPVCQEEQHAKRMREGEAYEAYLRSLEFGFP